MRPWTVLFLLGSLLALAQGVRWTLCWSGVVPERVAPLKEAVALRIAYTVDFQAQTGTFGTDYLMISDSAQVRAILETLRDSDAATPRRSSSKARSNFATVDFIFPDGTQRLYEIMSPTELRRPENRDSLHVRPEFHDALRLAVCRDRGKEMTLVTPNH